MQWVWGTLERQAPATLAVASRRFRHDDQYYVESEADGGDCLLDVARKAPVGHTL